MNCLSCFLEQSYMPQTPFAAQRKKGWCSCAHFASSRTGIITISMDTILMVSIFVILASGLLHTVLCLALLVAILTTLMITTPHSFISPNEQP